MGWNTYDICEVHPEHGVHHSSTRVDYILRDHESKQVCIEAKKVIETDFDFHEKQLLKYCAFKKADIGIFTNGIIWRFYIIHYSSKHLGAIKNPVYKEINLTKNNSNEILDIFIKYLWKGKLSDKERDPISIPTIDEIFNSIKSMKSTERLKFNEEAMKQGIVLPLLINLGWNIFDPSEIQIEKSAQIPGRRKREKVDYVLMKDTFKIVLEVKGLASDLSNQNVLVNDEGHLLDYIKSSKYDFGVLTNGIIWKFYLIKNGLYYGSFKINVKDKNVEKNHFLHLLSKNSVLKGQHLKYLEKLVD